MPSTGTRAVGLYNGVSRSRTVGAFIDKTGLLQKEVNFFLCPQPRLGRVECHHREVHQGFELGEDIVVMIASEKPLYVTGSSVCECMFVCLCACECVCACVCVCVYTNFLFGMICSVQHSFHDQQTRLREHDLLDILQNASCRVISPIVDNVLQDVAITAARSNAGHVTSHDIT